MKFQTNLNRPCYGLCLTWKLFFCISVLHCCIICTAALASDAECLSKAINAIQINKESIRTWKGKALITEHHNAAGARSTTTIDFRADYPRSMRLSSSVISNFPNKEKNLKVVQNVAVMIKDGVYYLFKSSPTHAQGILFIDGAIPPNVENSVDFFDPVFQIELDQQTICGTFLFWRDKVYQGKANFDHELYTINIEDNTLFVKTKAKHFNTSSEYELDLSRGGMLVKYRTVYEESPKNATVVDYACTPQQVNKIWIPKHSRFLKQSTKNGVVIESFEKTSEWSENEINAKISDDEFSYKNMGLRRGDFIEDKRTSERSVASGDELSAPDVSFFGKRNGFFIFRLVLIFSGLALIVYALFVKCHAWKTTLRR